MNPLLLLIPFIALGSRRRQPQPASASNNGPGVRYVPTASPVRARVPVGPAAPVAARAPATPATPAKAAAPTRITPSSPITAKPVGPGPSPAERAQVESAVKAAVAQFAKEDAAARPGGAAAPASTKRTPKQAALDLAAFLKRTGRFGSGVDPVPEVAEAQFDLGVKRDGIVGPVTRAAAAKQGVKLPAKPAAPAASRTAPKPTRAATKPAPRGVPTRAAAPRGGGSGARAPAQAARDLAEFLRRTHRFGSKTDRPAEVQTAQRDLGVPADGIVGPRTRAAAKRAGVTLPAS